jgi:hypothetical protein
MLTSLKYWRHTLRVPRSPGYPGGQVKRMADKTDAKEVKEVMEVISVEIPKLLESISNVIYKAENAEVMGKSIATFYKQMKEAGMDDKQAFEMTQQYMKSFSLGGMISQAIGGGIGQAAKKDRDDDD